ncbi:DUF4097 family beta strand repeat-containing protein [Brachyspira hyodysenteriae]|uniref:DUF4097 family beta strand repeat-containing protein n=1 Tax=Brachyspira hyodysenteriae TaxID=159 RepID=UPI001181F85C|nr:DUF4097 family beta strand repeat-containing protein [Brachyspira hyodysenteriae]TVL42039.1 hypothetical protein A9X73_03875 [Brachyspira hyodysenteriae]
MKKIIIILLSIIYFNQIYSQTSNLISKELLKFNNIKSISVLADIGNIEVKKSDKNLIYIENVIYDWIKTENNDGVLKISYKVPNPQSIKNMNTSKHKIIVMVSDNIKENHFNAGTGNLIIYDFNCNNLFLSSGTGNININNVNTDSLIIEAGTGKVNANNLKVNNNTEIHIGTGDITLNCEVYNKIFLEGGTGNVTMNINGNKNDYSVNGESFVRKIFVNGEITKSEFFEYEFRNGGRIKPNRDMIKQYNNTKNIINIDGSIGNIYINFKK